MILANNIFNFTSDSDGDRCLGIADNIIGYAGIDTSVFINRVRYCQTTVCQRVTLGIRKCLNASQAERIVLEI